MDYRLQHNAVYRHCLLVAGLGLATACDSTEDGEATDLLQAQEHLDSEEVLDPAPQPGADALTAPQDGVARVPGFNATIAQVGLDIDLTWDDQGTGSTYDVWRSTEAYFSPGDIGSISLVSGVVVTNYTDVGGNDTTSYYYRVEAVGGPSPGLSTTLGKFVQPMVSPGYTLLGFPLLDTNNRDGQLLADQILGVTEVWRWYPFQIYYTAANPAPPWNAPNFTWTEGEAVAVLSDGTSPTDYIQTGYVPLAGDIDIVLDVGANVVTVPLSVEPTDGIGLAAEVPTIYQLDNWNMTTQAFEHFYAPQWGTNFSIEPGQGLWVFVNEETTWPEVPHSAYSFVNAGTVSESPGYRLIWSFGQETQNQNTMDSASYTLRGGLIAASASE